jgi:hypothetical protein
MMDGIGNNAGAEAGRRAWEQYMAQVAAHNARPLPPHLRPPMPPQPQPYVPQVGSPFDAQRSIERMRRANEQAKKLQQNTQQTFDSMMDSGRDYVDQQRQERDDNMMAGVAGDIDSMWNAQAAQAQAAPIAIPDPMAGLPSSEQGGQEAMAQMLKEKQGRAKRDRQFQAGEKAFHDKIQEGVNQDLAGVQVELPVPEFELDMGPAYDQEAVEAYAGKAKTKLAADHSRTFGGDRPGDRGNLLPDADPARVPSGFSENSEAPLPGEETLPPGVAAWNDRRAKAGVRNGLDTLEEAWYADQDPMRPDFATWVQRKGIHPDMPIEEANARLDDIVSESLQGTPENMGKGWKDSRQKHQELVDKRNHQQQLELDRRGQKWVKDTGKRFAGQIGVESLSAAYQQGLQEAISKGSKNPHLDAVRSANASLVNGLRAGKSQQIRMNVKQDADQYNRAFSMGLPKAIVKGLDGLADAATPDDKFRALTVLHAQAPMMGFDKMAAMIAKGQIDNQALGAWAQQMGGRPSFDSDFARWNNQPLSETSYAGLMNMAQQQAGPNATPEQIQEKARQIGTGRATQAVQAMMTDGAQINPGDATFVRQLVGDMDFDGFAQTFGLDTRNQRARMLYEKVTGRPVGIRMFDDAPAAIGGAVAGVAGAIGGLMADPLGWMRPKQPPAQAQKPAAEPDPFA